MCISNYSLRIMYACLRHISILCLSERPKAPVEGSSPRKSRAGSSPHPLDDSSMKLLLVQGTGSDTLWGPLGGFELFLQDQDFVHFYLFRVTWLLL